MTGWELVGLLIVVAIAAVLILTRSRPKTAQELLQPKASSASRTTGDFRDPGAPQSIGDSEGQRSVRAMIESLHASRSTGMLTIIHSDETCSMSVLFGHFYHAECGLREGADAVRHALSWNVAVCRFDKTAPLPKKETITQSTGSLLESLATDSPPQS